MPYSSRAPRASSHQRQRPLHGHLLLDERTQQRLRRQRWRRLILLLSALAICGGLIALYFSPLLRVQEVQVVGANHIDTKEVIRLADLDGRSMLQLPLAEAGARIAALPLIKSVRAQRRWPQTVRLQIEERRPWGYWRLGGTTYVIDAEGVVLPTVQPATDAPVINDLGGPARLQPGDRVDTDAVALAQALLERVPQALSLGIATLDYTPQAGLALTTDTGYRVVLGDSQNLEYKLAVWQAIEKELGREAMAGHVLDLRFQNRPSFSLLERRR